ncbi:MAG: helix-turn-helix transcriptional regulator [Actinomycetota bacterium]|nr:helix-turn-helix transcriptional regulator [Actinomycetota bacterium]
MTRLEEILKEKGIKQVWLARKINKSPAELSRWLKGKRMPSNENMNKIAKVLGVSKKEIFFNYKVVVSANGNCNKDKSELIKREGKRRRKEKQKKI